jgi:TatD DNase family protein
MILPRVIPIRAIRKKTSFRCLHSITIASMSSSSLEFVDIGVNLTDGMFKGKYHGKKAHQPDLENVLKRAKDAGVVAQMVTAGSVSEVKQVLDLVKRYENEGAGLYATAGIHPTRTSGVGESIQYLDDLRKFLDQEAITKNPKGKIVAIGECGLDYDRLQFSKAEVQKEHFPHHLQLAKEYKLPLFLHCRAAQEDFIKIIQKEVDGIAEACENEATRNDTHKRRRIGVAHCHTGTVEEMQQLISQGLFIGFTGCSFKEEEGIRLAKEVPLEYLMLETGAFNLLIHTHVSFFSDLLKLFLIEQMLLGVIYVKHMHLHLS